MIPKSAQDRFLRETCPVLFSPEADLISAQGSFYSNMNAVMSLSTATACGVIFAGFFVVVPRQPKNAAIARFATSKMVNRARRFAPQHKINPPRVR
jgi:hypothetical protein